MSASLRETTGLCQSIVARGSKVARTSERAHYAHGYFSKATLHAKSILSLIDSWDKDPNGVDVGAVCVLARCVIEIRNASAYLLEQGISKQEAHLRLHLIGLNHATDLLRVGRGLETIKDETWQQFAVRSEKSELESNEIFASLDELHRKQLLRGRSPYQFSRYRGSSPLPKTRESALYTLLSQSAHSFSLGLSGVIGGGQASATGAVNAFYIATESAALYLADTAITYCRFRHRAVGALSEPEKSVLEEAASSSSITLLLKTIKNQSFP